MTTHPHRRERLSDEIQRVLSELIRGEMNDPRIGFVSITDVQPTPDNRQAKVFVSMMGSEQEQQDTLRALKHASGFLRRELGKHLTTRNTPELLFEQDTSIERGDHILHLLRTIEDEK